MTTKTETRHAGEFMVSEANGCRSRETETLITGQDLEAGTVIGTILSAQTATPTADAGNTGDGTMGAVTVTDAKVGVHTLTVIEPGTDAGEFQVEDPDGENIGTGTVGSAFTGGGLSFTLSDGATDFVAGDQFTIDVDAGSGKVTQLDLTGTDGSEVASGVLFAGADATAADKTVVVVARDAEVHGQEIIWPVGITQGQKDTALSQLADIGIIVR